MDDEPRFRIAWRGYERRQVDAAIEQIRQLGPTAAPTPSTPDFTIVLRGYDRAQVDAYLVETRRRATDRPTSVDVPSFRAVARGGYDPDEVDRFVARALSRIAELEARLGPG